MFYTDRGATSEIIEDTLQTYQRPTVRCSDAQMIFTVLS